MQSHNAKIIAFSTEKGGCGKSTISFNFGSYLALHGSKVLFIDLDTQMNMSSNFRKLMQNHDAAYNCSIYRAFLHDSKDPSAPFASDFQPAHVGYNEYLFSSHPKLDTIDKLMASANMDSISNLIVFDVIHRMKLRQKFDYIIIDTHNNFKTLTKNALLVSDIVFSPVIPNRYGIDSIPNMLGKLKKLKREFYDLKTGKSRITAKLYFVGNMIENNTNSSHQFAKAIHGNKMFVAAFPHRELFNRATTGYQSIYSLYHNENGSRQRRDGEVLNDKITPNFARMNKIVQEN